MITPPDWLRAEAFEFWHTLAPDLEAKGVLTPWDVEAFVCDRHPARLGPSAGDLLADWKAAVDREQSGCLIPPDAG